MKWTQVYFIRINRVFFDQMFFQGFFKRLPQWFYNLSDLHLVIGIFRIFTFSFNISFQISSKNYTSIKYVNRANKYSKSISKRATFYDNELKGNKRCQRNTNGAFIYLFIYLFIIHSHSLKSIKLYMVQITNQNRLPAPQYNILERDKID